MRYWSCRPCGLSGIVAGAIDCMSRACRIGRRSCPLVALRMRCPSICSYLPSVHGTIARPATRLLCLSVFIAILGLHASALAEDEPRLPRTTTEEDAGALGIGRLIPDLQLRPLIGDETSMVQLLHGRKGLVICMTSASCPLAVRYMPRLASIESEYARRGLAFMFVNAVDAESATDMQTAIRQNGLKGPYMADRRHDIQDALDARTTTEVFVLDAARKLVYRGAVDDQYGVGVARDEPKNAYLRDALEALLAGKRPNVQATWPPGCVLDQDRATSMSSGELTYYGRIAHIMAENCVGCHRQGAVAPFSLEAMQSVKGRVSMIEAVVRDRLMPPGHEVNRDPVAASPWVSDFMLEEDDRAALLSWLRSDRPAGQPADGPAIPPLPGTWAIGKPDLVVITPPVVLPVNGPMQYGRFVVPTEADADRWISDIEFRPMERDSVHHALVWILPPGEVLPKLSALPTNLQLLGAYSPADNMIRYPAGTARRLPAGSLLVIDLYARPMGRAKGARLRTAMRFSARPPTMEIRSLAVTDHSLRIAPHAADVEHRAELTLPSPVRICAVTPYMRARGESMELSAVQADQEIMPILRIERYDFRWPVRYERSEPLVLGAGTRLVVTGRFDNSADHISNPDPASAIEAGPRAGDEALFVVLETESALP